MLAELQLAGLEPAQVWDVAAGEVEGRWTSRWASLSRLRRSMCRAPATWFGLHSFRSFAAGAAMPRWKERTYNAWKVFSERPIAALLVGESLTYECP
jgi:hypothetical protein